MKRIVYISLLLCLCGCSSDTSALNVEISSIGSLRNIETNNQTKLITQNITIEGQVTANDEFGEFSSCIIIEDDSDAVEILFDMDDNYLSYPFGATLQVSCSGLYLSNHNGTLSLGAEPTGEYTLDYIDQSRAGQYLKISENQAATNIVPLDITISELTPLLGYHFVELKSIAITNDSLTTFCYRDTTTGRTVDTYHKVVDTNNDTITLFVDRLCTYADKTLPTTQGTINAIVDYFDEEYSLIITNASFVFE